VYCIETTKTENDMRDSMCFQMTILEDDTVWSRRHSLIHTHLYHSLQAELVCRPSIKPEVEDSITYSEEQH
jgi:hypothetical protein